MQPNGSDIDAPDEFPPKQWFSNEDKYSSM